MKEKTLLRIIKTERKLLIHEKEELEKAKMRLSWRIAEIDSDLKFIKRILYKYDKAISIIN
jgi:hypothetical protein